MMGKVITILEAKVSEDKWDVLRKGYLGLKKGRGGPLQSFLTQLKDDPSAWRIITVWKDMETLQKMRSSTEVPGGVLVFRNAGAEPTLTIFEVKEEI
jgi:hypothetical protein